ncbi:MAG: MBG domain-containing protein [Kiritimatiellae bacterium]|nr:MBG domain-containing protein [Kiritimatiellia bacterium]
MVDATDGQTSLREAIAHAADLGGEQTITFSDTDADGAVNFHDGSFRTLWLDGMELTIFSDVTIEGPGAAALNISADEQSRIVQVEADAVVTLSGLRFSGGRHPLVGGAVRNAGNLTLMDSYLFDNGPLAGDRPIIDGPPGDGLPPEGDPVPPPPMFGGAVYNDGMLTVINCAFSDNNATFGGGIANDGVTMIVNSTFVENGAFQGGALHSIGNSLLLHITVAGNTADAGESLWIDAGAEVVLNNSIVLGPIEGAFLDTDSNLIGGTFEDAGLETDGSGGLVFQNNGGQTPTIALVAGSPALFAGMPVEGVPTDQRGVARPQGFAPDLGAYEAEVNAMVTLSELTQTFDNTPKVVSVTTDPADLVVRVTYDGSSEAPTDAGSYTVVAVIESDGYFGGATDSLTINKGDQTLDFTAIPDQEPGNTVTLAASAGSGLPVSFAVTSGPGTITEGDQLSFTGEGPVVVTASQGGDDNWNAAEPVSQTIEVREFSQLELVIDLAAQEVYMIGTYTSPEVEYGSDAPGSFRLGFNGNVGGHIIAGAVASSSSPSSDFDELVNDIVVRGSAESLTVRLGEFFSFDATLETARITVTGNGEKRSFAGIPLAEKTFLTTLDGRTLYFQRLINVSSFENIAAAGTIQVIGDKFDQSITFSPEPESEQWINAEVTLEAGADSELPVSFAVTDGPGALNEGNRLSFTGTGDVEVTATQAGNDVWNAAESVVLTFTVTKAPATVTITDLERIFTGGPIEVTVTTVPDSLTVNLTYDGETDAPTAVGSYTVVATIDNPIYEGSATETLTIAEVPSLVVTTLDDVIDPTDGQTSLREAIAHAETLAGPQTITFSDTEAAGAVDFHDGTFRTITLGGTQLTVSSDVTIEGPGADRLAISGNNESRVFEFLSNSTSTLFGLGITEGNSIGTGEGGGILNNGGSLLVDSCRIVGNSASNGGGISTRNGQLVVRDSTLSENTAVTNGGGISIFSGTATILSSTLADNMAESGGGVYTFTLSGGLTSSPATIIRNSTLSGNTADSSFAQRGGGVANFNGVTEITSSTITANTGEGSSGIFSFNDSVTVTRIGQSIVAGNVGPELRGQNTIQRFVSLGHNLIGVAGDNVDFDLDFNETGDQTGITEPLLGPLADNGGPTLTHALLPGSPAIGASVVVAGVDTDQRGVPRPQGDNPDIGAYERGLSPQALDFPVIPEQLAPVPLTLSATASSGLEVTFEVLGGPATLAGNTLTFTGEGSVQVQATQAGNSEFLPADPVVRSFEVVKANATIFLGGLTQTFNGSPRSVNITTSPSSLDFVKTYDGLPDLPVNAGTYLVSVEVVDDFYEGVITDIQFTIQPANQTITFAEIDDQIVNQSIPLTATVNSGLEIVYSVTGPASLSGSTLTVTGTGLIEVTATQEGDTNWNGAEPVTRTFTGRETPSLVVTTVEDVVDPTDEQTSLREAITYAATLDGPQTITFSNTEANGAVNFHDGSFRTITLNGSQLTVSSDVTIEGPGAEFLAISGNNQSRVMRFTSGTTSTLEGLSLTQGATDGSGGGIFSELASLTLTRMTIFNNQADDLGGGVHHFNGTLHVNQSTISGNSAFRGGGIHTQSAAGSATDPAGIMIRNSTISGNTATDTGGGVRNVSGVMEITHSTLTSNTANSGGGVWSWNDGDTATRIGQSIVAGNSGGELVGFFTLQRYVSLGHNLIGQDVVNVDFNIEFNETGDQTGIANPLLGPLADNGGPTLTHAPLAGSPALGASVVVGGVNTDQRGVARPQGAAPDIGAFERVLTDQEITNVSLVAGTRVAVNSSVTLSGTASSGLAVEFESLTPDTVEISGDTATFIGTGDARIRFSQPGDASWNPAEPIDIDVIVGGEITGISPDKANIGGGIEAVISGNGLGNGSDISEVLLAGVPAAILSQTAGSVTVRVNAAETAGAGDVVVTSASGGTMVLEDGFEYLFLAAPEQLDPVDITSESLVARWELVPEADNHLLDVGLDQNFDTYLPGFEKLDVVNATQQLIPGLTEGEWYAVRLFARNEHGLSLPSRTVWVPTGNNLPFVTNPPTSGPVSSGATLFFNPAFMFHGSGMIYSVASSDSNVVDAAINANGLLRMEMMQPGQAVITVTATDPDTGYSSSHAFTIDVVDDQPTVERDEFLPREPWNMRFTQQVEIRNTSGMDAIGVRVLFSDLAPGTTVENRTGEAEDGRPILDVTTGFPAGDVLTFNIVYLATTVSPEAQPPTLDFEYILTDFRPPLPGVGTMITRQILLQDGTGRMVLEFESIPGALYAIEYMNHFPDGDWIEVPLRLRAGANRTQWIDAGPPATLPMEGVRVYRVKQMGEGEGQ